MPYFLEADVVHRATSAIESALKLLDQLDPDDGHFFTKADLENALADLNSGDWIGT